MPTRSKNGAWGARILFVLVAAVCTANATGAAAAWGAIAVSDTLANYAWGYSYGFGSAAAARRRALAECEKQAKNGSCEIKLSFEGGCGAVGLLEVTVAMPEGKTGLVKQLHSALSQRPGPAAEAMTEACEKAGHNLHSLGDVRCRTLALVCAGSGLVPPASGNAR